MHPIADIILKAFPNGRAFLLILQKHSRDYIKSELESFLPFHINRVLSPIYYLT
jgi:hypothetical protein